MNADRNQYLSAMGVEQWVLRRQAEPSEATLATPSPETAEVNAPDNTPGLDWPALQQRVAGCTLCQLSASRKQTVFGVGDHNADWLIIGEAPGADEDAQGEPFVGRAGKLLNAMLEGVGLKREQVYIANILKCRPPNNRDPRPEEVQHCKQYLTRQIELLKPKVILAVGRIAAQNLLQTEEAIGRLRGKAHRLQHFDIPVIATYHPAYLLRKPTEKRKAWEDLKLARTTLNRS